MFCRTAAIALLAATLAACQPPPPRQQLDRQQLQLQAGKLAGLCAEAALLARQVEQGSVNRAFAWVEQQAVVAQAGKAAADAARPGPVPLRAVQQQVLQLAAEVQASAGQVAQARDNGAALQALQVRLAVLQARAKRLAPPA